MSEQVRSHTIMSRPIRIPTYRNDRIRDFGLWYRDNESKLSEYFDSLCAVESNGCDFFEFAAIQHEREEIKLLDNCGLVAV